MARTLFSAAKALVLFCAAALLFGCAPVSDGGMAHVTVPLDGMAQTLSARTATTADVDETAGWTIDITLSGSGWSDQTSAAISSGATLTFDGIPAGTALSAEAYIYRTAEYARLGEEDEEDRLEEYAVFKGTFGPVTVSAGENPLSLAMRRKADMTLYANGGSFTIEDDSTVYTTSGWSIPPAALIGLACTDCTFTGWNTAIDGSGTGYSDGAELSSSDSLVLYAQWKIGAPYSVVFYANDGTFPDGGPTKMLTADTASELYDSFTALYEAKDESYIPYRDGYEFIGVSTDATATTGMTEQELLSLSFTQKHIIIYAIWKSTGTEPAEW